MDIERQELVINQLEQIQNSDERKIAALMKANLNRSANVIANYPGK